MTIYNINTTAHKEEDFLLQSNLTAMQIRKVITPIVERERNGGESYDNLELMDALQNAYPNSKTEIIFEPYDIVI